ncbi:T9SS type B sorting domain-containing protein, partial [Flavobacterium sp. ZS1P14]|uniref:T9SS type B sorting domain-containing protein n=1 Tax=Flavobacterium sp. ZS1P14 TaxID=3401729 RepID=UPI003AAA9C39
PTYTYEITAPIVVAAQTSNIFTGLAVGTYTIKVNSGRGCSAVRTVVIGEPLSLSVSGSVYECPTNNTFNTAVVSITAVGGTTGYAYSIDGANYFASNIFTIVATTVAQTINVYVKDANGCSATNTVIVNPLPTQTVSQTTAITCTNDETVTITGTGATGPFTYQSSPVGASNVIQDAVLPNVFHISQPGTYYFQVDDTATGCSITTLPYVVASFNTIDVVATATKPVICFGDANGALEINVTGYAGAYNYKVLGSTPLITGSGNTTSDPLIINGLSGGSYTIEVTETASPFCVKISNEVTIISPDTPLVVVANETASVTCTNDKGTITAVGSGGWGSLEYELVGPGAGVSVPYSGNATFANLAAGSYTVNVRDAKGCTRVSNRVTLSIPAPINGTFTPSTLLLSCFGNTDASITVSNVTGGQGSNYSYTLNAIAPTAYMSGPQSSPVFGGLGAGTYTVTITDGYSCSTSSANIVIAEPTKVTTSLVVATTKTCLTQTTLTLSAFGGTPPYTYSADGTTYGATFNPTVPLSVPAGTYHYYVKDANGCVSYLSNDIKIDPLVPLAINLDLSNAVINCAGDKTGVIVAMAQGGLGNYSYTLLDGLGVIVKGPQVSGNFTGLFVGNYQVKVDSGDCTTISSIITISEPASPLIAPYITKDVTCFGQGNGQITVTASGGTGIIKYAISPRLDQFFDSGIFIDLQPGSYDVIAQDKNGCYVYITGIVISEPNPIVPSLTAGSMLPEICFGDKDGAFSIDITGGTMPYSVSLDNANGVYKTGTLTQTQFDFTGLAGGTHTVYIKDANGCTIEFIVVMPESVKINPIATVDYGCLNNSASNSVTVTVDASITDLTDLDYSLNGAAYQTSNVFTNVAPGTGQFIDVRHTNGCTQRTPTFDILQIDPLALVLSDGGLNEIVATATGGGGGYQYAFNGESNGTKNTFIIYKSGDYAVEVTDSNGCVAKATRNFKYIDVCVPNYFTPNGDGVSDGWAPGCTINYKDLTFDIFDRYGRKIATYRLGQYWDGKYNGAELPSGDYWYVLKLNDLRDAREFVGHFTLYR